MNKLKIGFIGGGNMAEAILSALSRKGALDKENITVSDPSDMRRQILADKYPLTTTASNLEVVGKSEVIILAVKPQNLSPVLAELGGRFNPSQLVISIIAGVKIRKLVEGLGIDKVTRAMPNILAQIGQGVTLWIASQALSQEEKAKVRYILSMLGPELATEDEGELDIATAISGSGPAYAFFFMESLMEAAKALGMSESTAKMLIGQTLSGSGQLVIESSYDIGELRRRVTSPGGTTAAALKVFEEENIKGAIKKAIEAAYKRSKELSELA